MSLLQVKNLYKNFGNVEVLKGLNFELQKGGHYVIQGASGCGKSTLLYLLGALERPTKGDITFEGTSMGQMNDEQLARLRNEEIGFVFQFHFLLPTMTGEDNILLPGKIGNGTKLSHTQIQELAKYLQVQHCFSKYPYEMSGGEQQRINLIRALSMRPKLLLCDEPTGNLDSRNSQLVVQLLKELSTQLGTTLVVVTHDENVRCKFPISLTMADGVFIN